MKKRIVDSARDLIQLPCQKEPLFQNAGSLGFFLFIFNFNHIETGGNRIRLELRNVSASHTI